jgi:hypothetical protein
MTSMSREAPGRGKDRLALSSRGPRAIQTGTPRSRPAPGARRPTDKQGGGDGEAGGLHPEVEAFARWFCDWWLRRGRGDDEGD